MEILIAFVVGFALGVFERKVDRLKVKLPIISKEQQSEILKSPEVAELEKQESTDFYSKII